MNTRLIAALGLSGFISAAVAAQTGVQINTDAAGNDKPGDAANEPTLAVSPVNPDILVVGWREFPTISSDARYAGFAWSHDGGLTWTNGGNLTPPADQPSNAQQSDPLLDVDSDGVFYYWSEVFRPNPPTAHYVYQSTDGGMTWGEPPKVQDPATPGDKEWFVIDRTGGQGEGFLHGGWNNFDLGGMVYVRSTDGGQTFSDPVRIADQGGTQWMMQFAVGPDGEVYAVWRNYNRNRIYITKSTNASDGSQTPAFNAYGAGGFNGVDLEVDSSNDPGNIPINPAGFHQVYIDVDRSDSPRRGNVYVVWADDRRDPSDIRFARSTDGGVTWDLNIQLNDDAAHPNAYQWFPAMTVAPSGRIDVTWYDTRDDLGDNRPESRLYYSYSVDGGMTWSVDRPLSDPFDTTVGYPDQQKIGDYYQIKSSDAKTHIVYSATYNGGEDLWYLSETPIRLSVDPLQAGGQAQITGTGGIPGRNAWVLYSLTGPGETFIPQLGTTIGLRNPQIGAGPILTDGQGDFSAQTPVPQGAAGLDVWIQAVQVGNVSNVVLETVQP